MLTGENESGLLDIVTLNRSTASAAQQACVVAAAKTFTEASDTCICSTQLINSLTAAYTENAMKGCSFYKIMMQSRELPALYLHSCCAKEDTPLSDSI